MAFIKRAGVKEFRKALISASVVYNARGCLPDQVKT